jgi:GTP-binding protein HflX
VPYPIIALVGYTNAGKSTLFNRITQADVLAKDMLFATLDPTLRAIKLPHGGKVILSDTVGFISDLPTMLISAFRATLEEVLDADIVVHVRDISHEDSEAQGEDVRKILKDLGVDPSNETSFIEVWNKMDLLTASQKEIVVNAAARRAQEIRPIIVSALNGDGLDALLESIENRLSSEHEAFEIDLEPTDGQGLHWLYENTQVLSRKTNKKGITRLTIRLGREREDQMRNRFPKARAVS